jgi:anaerobic ribonucleoside-triphosphate reductase activating protein
MRIAGITKDSVVNGIGIRDVIFVQGCGHRCKGCHNPQTWDYEGGLQMDVDELVDFLRDSANPITISGGEPLNQFNEVYRFMETVHKLKGTRFWLYTGFVYEDLPVYMRERLAKYVDVLVDGKFEEDKRDLRLPFKGSANQRLIDLPKTFESDEIVLWEVKK